jgi:DNA ligase (NAD+)
MLDGMVIKIDNLTKQNELGFTLKAPKFAVAYKFPATQKITKLKDISLQVGRSGVVTPIALLEPIEIDGVIVERATLHNFADIKAKDIRIGDDVLLIRSGDVIPKVLAPILKNRKDVIEIDRPTKCPICESNLLIEDRLIKCQNLSCEARLINSIVHFVSKNAINIDGFGKGIVERLFEAKLLRDILDIYSLNYNSLIELDGFQDKKVKKILDAIENSKNPKLDRFIYSLGIEHIGEVASKSLAILIRDLNFSNITKEKLLEIDGFGEEMAQSLIKFISINSNKIERLIDILKPIPPIEESKESLKLSGLTFVLTGTMPKARDEVKSEIESMGGKVLNSISKKCNYLIYGEASGSKLTKANELGIETLTYSEFLEKFSS